MNNTPQENNTEIEEFTGTTNVEHVDINNTRWNGIIRSDSGDTSVTVNSITGLFLRNNNQSSER